MYVNLIQAADLIRSAEDILIVTHIRPDGDAAGSGCALCLGLRAMGKRSYLALNPPSMTRYQKFMVPYFATDGFVPRFIVAVDTPGPMQFPAGRGALALRTDLAVDHHGTNTGYAAATFLEPDSAATGELVYLLMQELRIPLTADIAEALYTAISTDTNCFRTAGTTARTLAIASALRTVDFDAAGLTRCLFETKSPSRLRLEAALYGSMHFPDREMCVMVLSLATVAACSAGEDEMDKLSLLTMVPEGVRVGLLLRELSAGVWKISLRTDGCVHAGRVLHALSPDGGGHADAAGVVLPGQPGEIEQAVRSLLDKQPKKDVVSTVKF